MESKVKYDMVIQNRLDDIKHLFSQVEGLGVDDGISRVRIIFNSGVQISCVRGHGMHHNNESMEVAILGKDGQLDYTLTDGDVLGYQTLDDLIELIKKVHQHYELN
jgi:hypothetical protein